MITKLTGNLLRAGRALAGLTCDDLAARTGLSRDVLRRLGGQQRGHRPGAIPDALPCDQALEGEGARFSGDGVSILSGDSPLAMVSKALTMLSVLALSRSFSAPFPTSHNQRHAKSGSLTMRSIIALHTAPSIPPRSKPWVRALEHRPTRPSSR